MSLVHCGLLALLLLLSWKTPFDHSDFFSGWAMTSKSARAFRECGLALLLVIMLVSQFSGTL